MSDLNGTGEDSSNIKPAHRQRKEQVQARRKRVSSNKMIKAGLGDRLRAWRKSQEMNLEQCSKKVKVGVTTLSEIENNKSLPSIETIARFYKKTNLNIFWLIFQEGSPIREKDVNKLVKLIKPEKPKKVIKKTIFNMTLSEISKR